MTVIYILHFHPCFLYLYFIACFVVAIHFSLPTNFYVFFFVVYVYLWLIVLSYYFILFSIFFQSKCLFYFVLRKKNNRQT